MQATFVCVVYSKTKCGLITSQSRHTLPPLQGKGQKSKKLGLSTAEAYEVSLYLFNCAQPAYPEDRTPDLRLNPALQVASSGQIITYLSGSQIPLL